jgi:hypothetical protein
MKIVVLFCECEMDLANFRLLDTAMHPPTRRQIKYKCKILSLDYNEISLKAHQCFYVGMPCCQICDS